MKTLTLFILFTICCPLLSHVQLENPIAETEPIASDSIHGVTVSIKQIQMQRIGADLEWSGLPEKLIGKESTAKFQRTVSIGLAQHGHGNSTGPLSIKLKNGDRLNPMMSGNQKFMSRLANAKTEADHDFQEAWFAIPTGVEFEDIFPIKIEFSTTTVTGNQVDFVFADITL